MAQISITTTEHLLVTILTDFSYDDQEVSFDPTTETGGVLQALEKVRKYQYSFTKGRLRNLCEEDVDAVYRHGRTSGSSIRRIVVQQGDYEFDSLQLTGLDEDELSENFVMDAGDLLAAKLAMQEAQAHYEKLVLKAACREGHAQRGGANRV